MQACILISIVNKSLIALLYSSLKGDKALYLLLSKGFLETGRLTEPVNAIENGSTVYLYNPAINSPLYSLLAAPFLWITDSFFWTQAILSGLGWIVFYTALYHVARLVLSQRWVVNIFILCSAFFLYPHELSSTPKDTFAAGLTLWTIVLMNTFLVTSPSWSTIIFLVITLISLALIKLLYVPLMVVLLFLFFVLLLLRKKKGHFIHACLLAGGLVIMGFAVSHFLLQPAQTVVSTSPISIPSNSADINIGFYPESLLQVFPFISSSFINTHLWAVQTEKMTPFSFGSAMRGFLFFDAFLMIIFIAASLFFSRKILSHSVWFFLTGVSYTMISVVLMLSLTGNVVIFKPGGGLWTYVTDARSFLVPMVTIQLVLFLFIFRNGTLSFFRKALLLLFCFAAIHGLYFTIKAITTAEVGKQVTHSDALTHFTSYLSKEKERGQNISLVTTDNFVRRYTQVQDLPAYSFTNQQPHLSWMKKS
ncbi:MAG TPA: hypothetical protein VER36_02885, partial [Flavisolibacter sp.]|nr:hypothetical protein [Flavisolibacter sp.]